MSEEQFQEWVNRRSRLPLAVKSHTFVIRGDDLITIDGGVFVFEDALQIVRMLNSRNPFVQFNANTMIWERNGAFRVIALALIAIILVAVIALVRR
jgi:hypothetical protein